MFTEDSFKSISNIEYDLVGVQVVRWDKGKAEPIEDYVFSKDKEWTSVKGRIMNTSENHIKI